MKGYVILIVTIILGSVLTFLVLSSINKFLERKASLVNFWLKERLKAAANACLEKALLNLKYDPNYSGNESISVDNLTCEILPLQTTQNTFIIKSKSTKDFLTVSLFLEINKDNYGIINYEEKVSF